MTGPTQTFANFQWEKRWNENTGACAVVMQAGKDLVCTGPMGTISIEDADVPYFIEQMRVFLGAIEERT